MRIVFVTPWVPSPVRPRPMQLSALLAERHEVHFVVATWSKADVIDAEKLPGSSVSCVRMSKIGGCLRVLFALLGRQSLQQAYVSSRRFRFAVQQAERDADPDVVFFNVARTSHLVRVIVGRAARVLDLDEFRSIYYQQTTVDSRSALTRLLGRIEGPRMARAEDRALRDYDVVLVSSPTDVPEGPSNVRNVRGGSLLAVSEPKAPLEGGTTLRLLFSGRMSYSSNVEAISWFCSEVLPEVWSRNPQTHLTIVGENPGAEVTALAGPRVQVVGWVPDMTDYFLASDIVIVPMKMATGVQQKLIGGLASGRLTICTSRVAALAGVVAGVHVLVADTAEEWIEAIDSVSRRDYSSIILAGQQWVVDNYSLGGVSRNLDDVLAQATSNGSAP